MFKSAKNDGVKNWMRVLLYMFQLPNYWINFDPKSSALHFQFQAESYALNPLTSPRGRAFHFLLRLLLLASIPFATCIISNNPKFHC